MKLLIIDDHEVVRQGIAALAKREGLDVVGEAKSKDEAIAMIAATSPEVITVDLSLPDGSGLEIVKFARRNSQSLGIVVISILDDDSNLLASISEIVEELGGQLHISSGSTGTQVEIRLP